MNVTDDGITRLALAEFEERHANQLETALQSEDLGKLLLVLNNYDGQSHLDLFRRAIAKASGMVALNGRSMERAVLDQFLTDIERNDILQEVHLCGLTFSAASLASLLRLSASVTALVIQGCQVAETTGTWEANVVRALNDNNVIVHVVIGDSDTEYLEPVITHLAHHPSLCKLSFTKSLAFEAERGTASLRMASIIRNLLMGGPSSAAFVLCCHALEFKEVSFRPIADGAINGPIADILTANRGMPLMFENCSFDESATELFETMFRPESNLRMFYFGDLSCSFSKPVDVIMETLLHPNSPLMMLLVSNLHERGGNGNGLISAIMKELAVNTTLVHLAIIDSNFSNEIFDIVTSGIKKLRGLRELQFANVQLNNDLRPALMDSLKRNHTIRHTFGIRDVFPDARDHDTLRSLETRNQKTADLLDNPSSIEPSLLPKVFHMIQECEHSASIIRRLLPEPDQLVEASSIDEENPDFESSGSLI